MTKTIAVLSGKGGTAKTTTTLGIGATIAGQGRSVVIVDTDPQDAGSSSWWLESTDDIENLSYISASSTELLQGASSVDDDVMIIDTAPRLNDDTLRAIATISDLVLIVSAPAPLDIAAAAQTVKTALATSTTPYMILLTRVDSRSIGEAYQAREELIEVGHPVAGVVIRSLAAVRRAPFDGAMPPDVDERHAQDLNTLVSELHSKVGF